jgi:NodT family efflux transporter outer membrane factor (OMF) lipoprotein
MQNAFKLTLLATSAVLLASCSAGPDYVRPEANVPAAYKELPEGWKIASPQDCDSQFEWWKLYNDPILNALEAQVDVSNENLKAADAAYRAAQAAVSESRTSFFPSLSLNASATRGKTANRLKPETTTSASAGASWDIDIWGRIRRLVESNEAHADASAADLAAARLSAQADVASNYFNLRGQDSLKKLLEEIAQGQQRTLKIAQDRYEVGVVSKADVAAAQHQLNSTRAQAIAIGIQRARYEHAIAALIGKTPDTYTLAPSEFTTEAPVVPVSVPSALLERRPDIAAAERQMAAQNAVIGHQTATFFPSLGLSASYGFGSSNLNNLFQASNALWSVGGSIAETIFDAGAREARIDAATANYDKSVAFYRQTILTAFQEVEDQLAALRILAQQAEAEKSVVSSAREAERLILNQYKAGIIPFSSVVIAQSATLSSEQSALDVRRERLLASVSLIKALGGSWRASRAPIAHE